MLRDPIYKRGGIFLTYLIFSMGVYSQIPSTEWEKLFKMPGSCYFSDGFEAEGGNLIVLGAIEMPGDRNFDLWFLELTEKGDTVKTKVFRNEGKDTPFRVVADGTGGYFIAYISRMPGGEPFSRLIAVDTEFNERWVASGENPVAIDQTDAVVDGEGFIWWVNSFEDATGVSQIALWKMNPEDGSKTDKFLLELGVPATANALRYLPDGTLAVACQMKLPKGNPAVGIVKVDKTGKVVWKSQVTSPDKTLKPHCLCCGPGNNLYAGGWSGLCYNPDAPPEEQIWDYDFLLAKIDGSGKILWTENYSREGSERGTALSVLPDGKILAAGKCETSFTGTVGPWLLIVDEKGTLIDDQVYKFNFYNDQAARIILTSNGGFVLIGPGCIDSDRGTFAWIKKLKYPVL